MNREKWLSDLAKKVEPLFGQFDLKPYRVTCGWPCRGGLTGKVLGECHSQKSSADGVFELFVTPRLDDPAKVSGVLVHEMTHVVAGIEAGHGRRFDRIRQHVGLTKGKATSAMPGEALAEKLAKLWEPLGPYPHKALVPVPKLKPQKEPSVMSLECGTCGCVIRISRKWHDESGPPTCGCGSKMDPKESE